MLTESNPEYTVLLIEDEDAHRELIQRAFEESPQKFRLLSCETILEAKKLLDDKKPDIVLSDMFLVDGKATSLLPEKREDVAFPMVVITSFGDEQIAVDVMKRGAFDYVAKSEESLRNVPQTVRRAFREWENLNERRQLENELRESEKRFRAFYDSKVIGIFTGNVDGQIHDANEVFLNMLGYDRTALPFDWMKITPEEWLEQDRRKIREIMETGALEAFEKEYIRKDGLKIPVLIGGTLIGNKSGEFICFGLDLSEKKKAEADFHASEERHRHIVETANDLVWETNQKAEFTFVGPQASDIFGRAPEEMLAKTPEIFMDKSESDKIMRFIMGQVEDKVPFYQIETIRNIESGEKVYLETSGVPFYSDSGKWLGYRGVIRNITAHREMEKQLRHAQKMEAIGTLAGGIAHDFNNILSPLMGYTQMAIRVAGENKKLVHYLNEIRVAGSRAKKLISQILTFSRRTEHESELICISPVINEAIDLFKATLPDNIEIVKDIIDDKPVMADPTQIYQVIMNLCRNAEQAMETNGGTLAVSLSAKLLADGQVNNEQPAGEFMMLKVSDTGCGMPKEVIERIFEPFYTTKPVGDGTGMGLAQTHGIVRDSGGFICVDSVEGKGSAFRVYLPVHSA